MLVVLKLLAQPLIQAAASVFGRVLLDLLQSWQSHESAKAAGRAEAERDAAIEVAERTEDMAGVPLPDDAEVRRRLEDGSA